jgi:hypothetical protein
MADLGRSRPAEARPRDRVLWASFVAACLVCIVRATLDRHAVSLDGLPTDNDSLTRIAFLEWAVGHGSFARHVFARDAAPFGLHLHWTAPYDVAFLAVSSPFAAVHGWHDGLREGAALMPAVMLVAACGAVAWLCLALGARRAMPWALMVLPLSGTIVGCAVQLPVKHPILCATLATLALASALRTTRTGGVGQSAWTAGWLVLAPWCGMEAMPGTLLAAAVLVAGSARRPTRRVSFLALAGFLAVGSVIPLLFDPDPDGALALASDRYSPLHAVLLCDVAAWIALAPLLVRGSAAARGAVAAILAVPAVAVAAALAARVPGALLDPLIHDYFVAGNIDLMPSWAFPAMAVDMALPTAAMAAAAVGALRAAGTRQSSYRICAFVALAAEVALGWRYHRFSQYPAMLAPPFLGAAACWAWQRMSARIALLPGHRVALSASLMALACYASRLPIALEAPLTVPSGCQLGRSTANMLADLVPANATLMTDVWIAPEVLARTREMRTVAGPYHRNLDGIRDVAATFAGSDDGAIRRALERRHASYVLACVSGPYVVGGAFRIHSLEVRLALGQVPPWLEPLALGTSAVRLYRVVPLPPGGA